MKQCEVCGVGNCGLDAHHIKPRHMGGGDDPFNLITLCKDCHKSVTHTLKHPFHSKASNLMFDRLIRTQKYIATVNDRGYYFLLLSRGCVFDWSMGGKEVKAKEMKHHFIIEIYERKNKRR